MSNLQKLMLSFLLVLAFGFPSGVAAQVPIRKLFQNPPDDCRPLAVWTWTAPPGEDEIGHALQSLKAMGYGGVEVQIEAGSGRELSNAFRAAAGAARKLGLKMDLSLSGRASRTASNRFASVLRCERVPVPDNLSELAVRSAQPGERFLAAFSARTGDNGADANSLRELSITQDSRGTRVLLPPDRSGAVLLFFADDRAAQNSPALDPYDRAALASVMRASGDTLLDGAGPDAVRTITSRPAESSAEWTPAFLDQFRKRRGYDLKPYLPALLEDIGERTSAIRHDYGLTLAELYDDEFLIPLLEWSRRWGVLLRIQAHGPTAAGLGNYAWVDIPAGSGGRWSELDGVRWASSAAHVFGRLASASTVPVDGADFGGLKAEVDRLFLQGITMISTTGWNPGNAVPVGLADYIRRTAAMLRYGEPVSDIALYTPAHDAWSDFRAGHVSLADAVAARIGPALVPRLIEGGYNYDLVDDVVLTELGRIEKGRFILGKHGFRIILLPGVERIPLPTMQVLHKFARSGGIVIATRRLPSKSPGFRDQEKDGPRIASLARELFESPSAPGRYFSEENEAFLIELGKLQRPDLIAAPKAPALGFVHRSGPEADMYFLVNTGSNPLSIRANFRVTGKSAEWWDPYTGAMSSAQVVARTKNGTVLEIEMEPFASGLLVFGARPAQ